MPTALTPNQPTTEGCPAPQTYGSADGVLPVTPQEYRRAKAYSLGPSKGYIIKAPWMWSTTPLAGPIADRAEAFDLARRMRTAGGPVC